MSRNLGRGIKDGVLVPYACLEISSLCNANLGLLHVELVVLTKRKAVIRINGTHII